MATIDPVIVQIQADISNLKTGLSQAEGSLKSLDGNVKKTGGAFGGFGDTVKRLGVTLGATFAATQIISFFKESVAAATEAASAQVRLSEILRNTGAATEAQIVALNAQAEALSKVGIASKENITVTQSQLATFDLQGKTIATLTPAILDYVAAEKGATASTDDYKQMTNGLAQALQGNFAALTRVGFVLDEDTKKKISNGSESERAAAITEVLNSTYKDFNKTLAETPEGRMIKLKQEFDDLKQTVGEALLPVLQIFMGFLNSTVIPILRKAADFVKTLTSGLSGGDGLSSAFKKVTEEVKKFFKPLIEIGQAVAGPDSVSDRFTALVNVMKGFYGPILGALKTALTTVRNAIVDNKDRIVSLLATFREIGAWLLKYIVPLFREVLVFAIKQFGGAISGIVKVVVPVVQVVGNVIKGLVNGIISVINGLIKAYNKVAGAFGKDEINLISKIGEKASGVSMQLVRMGKEADKTKEKLKGVAQAGGDVWAGSADPKGGGGKDAAATEKKVAGLKAKGKKVLEDMEKEKREAAEAIAKEVKKRDERIAEANKKYAERKAELEKDYNERKAEIEKDYKERQDDINKRFNEAELEAKKRYKEAEESIDKEYKKRTEDALKTQNERIASLTKSAQDKIADITKKGQDKLAEIVEKGRERLRSAWQSGTAFSLKDLFGGTTEGETVIDTIKAQLSKVKTFQQGIGELAGKGYSQTFIEEIAKAGPEAGTKMLEEIRKLSPEQQTELQQMYKAMEELNTSGMDQIANSLSTSTKFATKELEEMYRQTQEDIALALAEVNKDLNENIASAKKTYEEAMADAAATRTEKLAEANKNLSEALAEAKKNQTEALAEAKKQYDEALLEAKKRLDEGLADAQKALNEAIQDAMKDFDDAVAEINERLKKRLEELKAQLAEIAKQLSALGAASAAKSLVTAGNAIIAAPLPVTPKATTTVIPRAVAADGSIASWRAGEEKSMAGLTVNQTFTNVTADAWDIHEKTLSAIRYGQAVTPKPTPKPIPASLRSRGID